MLAEGMSLGSKTKNITTHGTASKVTIMFALVRLALESHEDGAEGPPGGCHACKTDTWHS